MIDRLRYAMRKSAATLLYRSGFLEALARHRLRHKALVLMYHRILKADEYASTCSHHSICVTTKSFENQIQLLKSRFRVLSLQEFLWHLERQQPFADRSVLITFDDGWQDNYRNALPILIKEKIPATIFLTTAFIGQNKRFWQERLTCLLRKPAAFDINHRRGIDEILRHFKLVSIPRSRKYLDEKAITPLINELKNRPLDQIEAFISELEHQTGDQNSFNDNRVFMNWDEVRESLSSNIEIGSHGIHHTILTVERENAEDEITRSKSLIESQISAPVSVFSYPNGNYSTDTVRHVKRAGYKAAFTTKPGYVDIANDPFTVFRFNVHEAVSFSATQFLFRLVGR